MSSTYIRHLTKFPQASRHTKVEKVRVVLTLPVDAIVSILDHTHNDDHESAPFLIIKKKKEMHEPIEKLPFLPGVTLVENGN